MRLTKRTKRPQVSHGTIVSFEAPQVNNVGVLARLKLHDLKRSVSVQNACVSDIDRAIPLLPNSGVEQTSI